jgi:DNA-binding MarR family transcriptional regulator
MDVGHWTATGKREAENAGPTAPDDGVPIPEDRVGAGMKLWRREFPDIDCSGKGVVGRLLHLNELMLGEINRTLARHRLAYSEFAVLATLRVQGAPYRMSPKALLDSLILTSGGLSNILRRLERSDLIRRMPDEADGRGVIVELTEAGRRRVEPAMHDHAETELKLLAALAPSEQSTFARTLARMMAGATHDEKRAES